MLIIKKFLLYMHYIIFLGKVSIPYQNALMHLLMIEKENPVLVVDSVPQHLRRRGEKRLAIRKNEFNSKKEF